MGAEPILQLLGAFGDQQPGGHQVGRRNPVELPPFDRCAPQQSPTGASLPGLVRQIDVRLHPDDGGFRRGEPTGRPEMRGWFALADSEPIDEIGLLLAADAMPPPIFNSGLPSSWVPTVELTVHVRGTPAPGPLRCAFRSRHIHDGLLEEDGEIWDSTGTLVCQSRQLALMPR
jgi:acyl-CoA thioesterase